MPLLLFAGPDWGYLSHGGFRLGVTIVATVVLLQSAVQEQIQSIQRQGTNHFIIDIQPDQWSGVKEMLNQSQARHQQSAPVVMAAKINGRDA